MTPTKPRSLFPTVSKVTGQNQELVSAFIEFFYRNLRTKLSDLEFTRVFVEDFGTFYVKERVMSRERAKCERIYNYYINKDPGIRRNNILEKIKFQLERIVVLEEIVRKRNEAWRFLRLHKKNFYENKAKIADTLEGEKEDPGSLV